MRHRSDADDRSRRTVMKAAGASALGIASLGFLSSGAVATDRHGPMGRGVSVDADRHGPMRTGRFKVEIDDVEISGWRSVTIPSSTGDGTAQVIHFDHVHEQDLWEQTEFDDLENDSHIRMERGVQPGDTRIFDWREEVRLGELDDGGHEVAIVPMDEEGEPQIRWEFQSAWIKDYDPPELDADADGDVATESITVAFDKMVREEQ